MLNKKFKDYNIILASGSPRRQQFLKELGLNFTVKKLQLKEEYPKYLHGGEITNYLSKLKADAYPEPLGQNDILITADTIVRFSGKIYGKPKDAKQAKLMLKKLAGGAHEVISSVCIKTLDKTRVFSDATIVWFDELTKEEIDFYVDNYQPFDKAGSYGIQEWLGYIGVVKIEGSFYNVMGFPVHKFYKEMVAF